MSQRAKMWLQLLREMSDETATEYIEGLKLKTSKSEIMAEQTNQREIKIPEVIELLKKGYTRYKKDDKGFGSIQEKYDLSFSEVRELFGYDKLRGVKTKTPSRLKIIDGEAEAPKEGGKAGTGKEPVLFE
jgi:hypothetical protein